MFIHLRNHQLFSVWPFFGCNLKKIGSLKKGLRPVTTEMSTETHDGSMESLVSLLVYHLQNQSFILGLLLRCLEKQQNILPNGGICRVWWWFTTVQSITNHFGNPSHGLIFVLQPGSLTVRRKMVVKEDDPASYWEGNQGLPQQKK